MERYKAGDYLRRSRNEELADRICDYLDIPDDEHFHQLVKMKRDTLLVITGAIEALMIRRGHDD